MAGKFLVLLQNQRVCVALFSSAARSSDSVRVSVYVPRYVVVDNCADVRNVQASCCKEINCKCSVAALVTLSCLMFFYCYVGNFLTWRGLIKFMSLYLVVIN